MKFVETVVKLQKAGEVMVPSSKNVVYVSSVEKRQLFLAFQVIVFEHTHKYISVIRYHFGPHCFTVKLKLVCVTERKVVKTDRHIEHF